MIDLKMSEEGGNLTLRRLEGPIHKFTKVALPTDLERLQRHHSNILKHSGQWDRLHQEHINASRTVQQLRSNVREMEKLCGRVRPEDSPALERLVQPIRDRASAATQDFLLLHSNPAPLPQAPRPPDHSSSGSGSHGDDVGREPPPVNQTQLLLPVIPLNESAAESWDTLEEDLKELSGLVTEFSLLVHSQQEKIDSIEENVNTAAANVEEGTRSLGKVLAQRSKVLHRSAKGITTDPGSILDCITTSCDLEPHRAAHNWPSIVWIICFGLFGLFGHNIFSARQPEDQSRSLRSFVGNWSTVGILQ
uniref:Syntaxin 17 n=1 Tax=Oncorhynchus mykiss TaxID=8022 RepID=A0A8C7LJL4_ONCMY